MPSKWSDIQNSDAYKNLGEQDKAKIKVDYFNSVIKPSITDTDIPKARGQFFAHANRIDIDNEKSGFLSTVLDIGAKTVGPVLGAASSPLAFVWGTAGAPYTDEKYAQRSLVGQVASATAEGAKAAYRSITNFWEQGSPYGTYYKHVTGKTIEESLPDNLKWAAPTLEFAADIVSDPLIAPAKVYELAKLKTPKFWQGKMPPSVAQNLERIEKLEAAEKTQLQQKMVGILKSREEYIKWWDDVVRQMDAKEAAEKYAQSKIGPPLFKEGERLAPDLTAPRSAMVGAPKREFATEIAKETPVLSARVKEATVLGKVKPTPPEPFTAKFKVDLYRQSKGLEPLSPVPTEELKRIKGEKVLSEINKFRSSKGLTPFTSKSMAGAVLGVEEDEDGNFRYNVGKGLAGMLIGTAAISAASGINISKMKDFDALLSKYPAWEKVHGMIGKPKSKSIFAGLLGKINVTMLDRFAPLKKFRPAYIAARIYPAYRDIAQLKFNALAEKLKPIAQHEVIFTDYVDAHRAMDRAKRGFKNPNGVKLSEAKQAIKDVEDVYVNKFGGNIDDLRTAMKDFQEWTRTNILDDLLDSGIISQESYNDIVKNNKWYAAYDVIDYMPDTMDNLPAFSGREYFSLGSQDVVKGIKGTERQIDNPIVATVRKFAKAQELAARNRVVSELIDDPQAYTNLGMRPVVETDTQYRILQSQGKNPIYNGEAAAMGKTHTTISRFKNGKVEKYLVDRDVGDVMKRLAPASASKTHPAINKIVGGIGRTFRSSATTLYLPFTISNAMRDGLMAYTTSTVHGNLPVYLRDWGRGLWEGLKFEFGKSDIAERYIKAGGGFGYSGEVRSLRKVSPALFEKGLKQKGIDVITSPLRFVEKMTSAVELAPRIATFKRAEDIIGMTTTEAVMAARESTIDFNRAGTIARVWNLFVPFLNARIQGRLTVAQALARNPKNFLSKTFLTTAVPGFALYAYNRVYHGDLYDDIPEYVKQKYFTFITGTDVDDKGRTVPKYFVVPKGDIGEMSWNAIEFALDKAYGKDPQGMTDFLVNTLNDFSPFELANRGEFSGSKLVGGLMPPIAKGVVENLTNYNFYRNRPIVDYYTRENKPPELQYYGNTPDTYKWLSRTLADKADVHLSPLMIQNFMSNVFAGYGREGLDPQAMLKGLTGRLTKSTGGEVQYQANKVVDEMEKGYKTTRAFAIEAVKNGKTEEALRLIHKWNDSISSQISEYDKKFGRYGYEDRGGLMRSYTFTLQKMKNIMAEQNEDNRTYLEKRLQPRR